MRSWVRPLTGSGIGVPPRSGVKTQPLVRGTSDLTSMSSRRCMLSRHPRPTYDTGALMAHHLWLDRGDLNGNELPLVSCGCGCAHLDGGAFASGVAQPLR